AGELGRRARPRLRPARRFLRGSGGAPGGRRQTATPRRLVRRSAPRRPATNDNCGAKVTGGRPLLRKTPRAAVGPPTKRQGCRAPKAHYRLAPPGREDSGGGKNLLAESVLLVEDDRAMGEALRRLLRAAGFSVTRYASAEALLESGAARESGCLVVDINLPGIS